MGWNPVKTGRPPIVWLTLIALFTAILSAMPMPAHAEGVNVILELNRLEITPEDSVRMIVKVNGSKKLDRDPRIDGLKNFHVSRGGTSARLQIINSKINSGIDYTYFIKPNTTGRFSLGPATVSVDGRLYKSNRIALLVKKRGRQGSVEDSIPTMFLTTELATRTAFIEQQVIYTVKLFFRARISDLSLDLPEQEHMTLTQLGKPTQYNANHEGVPYQVLEVRYSLVAVKEGLYPLSAARMSLRVYTENKKRGRRFDSIFNDPFFSTGTPAVLAGKPQELKVLALPEAGRPDNFSGLVGSFSMKATLLPIKIEANESATLTVNLEGTGNVNRIPDLKVPELEAIKVYADKPVLTTRLTPMGTAGTKTMKWALVPAKEGKYTVPQLSLSYFDVDERQYKTLKTPAYELDVRAASKAQTVVTTDNTGTTKKEGPAKKEVEELGHDILPIHGSLNALNQKPLLNPFGLIAWIILALPLMIYVLTLVMVRVGKKTPESEAATLVKLAAKKFNKKFRGSPQTANSIILHLRTFLNERFRLSLGALTPKEAETVLINNGCAKETASKIRVIVSKAESAIYSGQGELKLEIDGDLSALIRQIARETK